MKKRINALYLNGKKYKQNLVLDVDEQFKVAGTKVIKVEKGSLPSEPPVLEEDWTDKIRLDYKNILSDEQIEATIRYWKSVINQALKADRIRISEAVAELRAGEGSIWREKRELIYKDEVLEILKGNE